MRARTSFTAVLVVAMVALPLPAFAKVDIWKAAISGPELADEIRSRPTTLLPMHHQSFQRNGCRAW